MDRPTLLDHPKKPPAPKYFDIPLSKVPASDIDIAVQNTKEYLELLAKFEKERRAIMDENRKRENEYQEACWNKIYEDNDIEASEKEHPLVKWAASKAWEHGHAHGMSDVSSYFSDFIEAYNIHRKVMNDILNKK